jgi:two-component system alkaline phosphatase synthesis response regulator PhoP
MITPKKKIHILIIDDDETMRRLYGSLLGLAGYEVLYAENGLLGREAARRLHPDLILLDLSMPGEDGYQIAKRILKEPDSPASDIPIALLSNADLPIEAQQWMKEIGIIDYIHKGINNDEFIARIKSIFEKVKNKPPHKPK